MDIFDTFREHANPEQAVKMNAYMRDKFQFLGIPTPERKKLSREFIKAIGKEPVDWDFLSYCWEQPEREFQYFTMDCLARQKTTLTTAAVPLIRELAIRKSWWDTIDGLDVIISDIAFSFPEVNATLLEWSVDDNFWLRRIAIDHQLGRKDRTDADLLERIILNNLGQSEFFINKAIGWSLREYSKTNPDWVRGFIERHRGELAALSVREASKYL
jgi:3-methyladenine DNA glycosylase AlkD